MNLTLVLTHQCNLACHYCYAGEKFSKSMTWDTARASMDLALEGPSTRIDLSFFGGEPLLEWDMLVRCTEYMHAGCEARGKRLRLLVTTNGTRLTDERLAWLIERNFYIGYSMDGGPEATARARPFKSGRSSFEATQKGLRRLLASGYSRYEVLVVVDPASAPWLAESVDYLVDEGATRISMNPNFFTAWDDEAKAGWRAGYERAAERWLDSYRRGAPLFVNVIDAKVVTAVKGGFDDEDHCSFEGGELAVAPSGNLYPCERLVGDDRDPTWVLGNVHEGGLSPHRACAAATSCGNVDSECAACPLQSRCMNWCGCTNYMESGMANRSGGNLCWHEKMAIPLADRTGRILYEEDNPAFLQRFYLEPQAPSTRPDDALPLAV